MEEKILIIDDDLDTLRLVSLMLQRQGYKVSAASNGSQGLAKAADELPDLILLDVMMPDMDGYEVTRRLRKDAKTVSTPILMFTAKIQLDDKVSGFEVGADDYLTKPTHPSELQSHVRALLMKAGSKNSDVAVAADHENRGFVIGVLAARGGLGVSSLALNLAAALYNKSQEEVILAELAPGQGTFGRELGLSATGGLNDALLGKSAGLTREKVQTLLAPHSSGIKLLLASENPKDISLTSEVQNYLLLLTRLTSLARFVVLDLGVGLPKFVQEIIPRCHECMVVVEGEPGTIQKTKYLMDEIMALKKDKKAIQLVLNNRHRSETQMQLMQVQEKLVHPISATLAPAPEVFQKASKMQIPAILAQPTNGTSQQIIKLAETIIEHEKSR